MAPRSIKTKKAADVKVESEVAPKKGRSKAKVIDEVEPEIEEPEVNEKVRTENKSKRGKKTTETNGVEKTNGSSEVSTKKGKKKNNPELVKNEEEISNLINEDNDKSEKGESPVPQDENIDSNGHTEETETSSKKKRGPKKEPKKEPANKQDTKGKKNAKQEKISQTENVVQTVKPAAKGKGRKAEPKPEDVDNSDEEAKAAPTTATKSRKKAAKTKSPELEADKPDDAKDTVTSSETDIKPTSAAKGRKKAVKAKSPEATAAEPVSQESTASEKKPAKGKKAPAKKGKAADKAEEEPSTKKRKNYKEEKGQGDNKYEEQDAAPAEPKPKGKRGQKKAPEPEETDDVEIEEANTKRKRKLADEKAPVDVKKKAPLKNKADTNYDTIDFSNTSTSPQGKEWNFKISSWNVDGIRAWMTKGGLDYVKYEKPDILCLQEVKCSKDKLPEEAQNLPGYHAYWLCSEKDGYAGVGIYTTKLAMNVLYGLGNEELDSEGRIITAEYEHFYLICTYVPNAGRKLVTLPKRLEWNQLFRKHVQDLDKKKPVIICGDMNVAHNTIDLANPKTNMKNAGFTREEREGMTDLLGDGFVDTFRALRPDATGAYTFWTYMMGARAKNVGWRLDYFIVSSRLVPVTCDSVIRDQVYGSDHCPIALFLHLTTADKPKESI